MFTLSQIKEVHSKVKSGADFPAFIQDIIKLGVKAYDTFVSDGHSEFTGADNVRIQSEGKYTVLTVNENCDGEKFKTNLKSHQQGQSDYLTFCSQAAECGIEKWTVDTSEMTCTYFDKKNNKVLEEKIPG